MRFRPPGTLAVLALFCRVALLRVARGIGATNARRTARRGPPSRRGRFGLLLLFVLLAPIWFWQSSQMAVRALDSLAAAAARASDGERRLAVDRAQRAQLERCDRRLDAAASDAERERCYAILRDELLRVGGPDEPGPDAIVSRFRAVGLDGFERAPRGAARFETGAWPAPADEPRFLAGVAVVVTLIVLMLLVASFGLANEELGRVERRFVQLFEFPVATRSLVLAAILQHALVQFFAWFLLAPLLVQLGFGAGLGLAALPFAVVGTLGTTLGLAAIRVLLETWLRQRFAIQSVRTLQAIATVSAMVLLGGGFAALNGTRGDGAARWFVELALAAPELVLWSPQAWPVTALRSPLLATALGFGTLALLLAVATRATTRLLEGGIEVVPGAALGTRGVAEQPRWTRTALSRGVLGKELALLARDRNFFAQTILVPIALLVMQVLANPGLDGALRRGGETWAAPLAYGIGAMALSAGCFQVLAGEGRALWLLVASPIPLETAVAAKLRLWTAFGLTFAGGGLFALSAGDGFGARIPRLLYDLAFVVPGVICAGRIAAGLGALQAEIAEENAARTVRGRSAWAYWFLAGTYGIGLASSAPTTRIATLVLFWTIAFAIHDRMRAFLPFVFDARPPLPPRVTVLDAVLTCAGLFAGQALFAWFAGTENPVADGRPELFWLTIGLVSGGAVAVAVAALVFVRRGIDLRALAVVAATPSGRGRGLALGLAAGTLSGVLGIGWLLLARRFELVALPVLHDGVLALVVLAVLAAPLFEEFVFRGLLFRSLAGLVSVPRAIVGSAAVFAACHPSASWVPVFVLGCLAAWVFHRTGRLTAAMLAHAVHNAIAIAGQLALLT